MTAWTDGRNIGMQSRATKEQRRQFDITHGEGTDFSLRQSIGREMQLGWDNMPSDTPTVEGDPNLEYRERMQQLEVTQGKALEANGHPNYGASDNPQQQEMEIQKQQIAAQGQQIQQMQGQMSLAASDNALLEFMEHGDANVIQQALRNDPNLGAAWYGQGGQHVSNIDLENDTHLLDSIGLTPEMMAYEELRNLVKKNIYKVWDGEKWSAASAQQLAMETGVVSRVPPSKSSKMIKQFGQFNAAGNGVMAYLEEQKANTAYVVAAAGTKNANTAAVVAATGGQNADTAAVVAATGGQNADTAAVVAGTGQQNADTAAVVAGTGQQNADTATVVAGTGQQNADTAAVVAGTGQQNADTATVVAGTGQQNADTAAVVAGTGQQNADTAAVVAGTGQQNADTAEVVAATGGQNADTAAVVAATGTESAKIKRAELDERIRQFDIEQKQTSGAKSTDSPKTKYLRQANAAKASVVEDLGGGREKYFSTIWDESQPNFDEIEVALMSAAFLTDSEMSESDKYIASNLNKVNILGAEAAKLGKANTGYISAPLDSLGRYTIDQINGLEQVAAWNLLNTVLLRAEGGKVLSKSEIELHKKSHGSLLEQWKPLMIGLKQSLAGKLADADSLISSRGRVAGWFYHGKAREGISKTIALIDRLMRSDANILEKKAEGDNTETKTKKVAKSTLNDLK